MGHWGSFPGGKAARAWKWTHLHLVAKLRIRGAIPPLPQCQHLYLYLTISDSDRFRTHFDLYNNVSTVNVSGCCLPSCLSVSVITTAVQLGMRSTFSFSACFSETHLHTDKYSTLRPTRPRWHVCWNTTFFTRSPWNKSMMGRLLVRLPNVSPPMDVDKICYRRLN
jgi:hypothetical protein